VILAKVIPAEHLIAKIITQPESREGRALLTPEEFFTGNDDLGSIGCNLPDHPGLDYFRRIVEMLERHPNVESVWMQIYDWDEGDWPFVENVLIFGETPLSDVERIAAKLLPSEIEEMTMDWTPTRDPKLYGRSYINLWWD
jgi:hypothetical protein